MEEPVGNNDSNLWCDLLSKKTTERFNFNENDIGEATTKKENNYDNSNGQIIWTRDESVNFNKYPIKENIKPIVTKDNYTPYNLQLEIAKALLLSKYIPNKAYVCDRNERRVIKYQWSISNTFILQKGTMLDIRINGDKWSIYLINLTTKGWYLEEITLSKH